MSKKIIYCFSGTGNSMNAAMNIAEAQTDTRIVSMRCEPEKVSSADADVIGFVFPIYHWSLPDAAKEFIRKVEINPNAYIFAVATCGGWPVNALNDCADLIKEKGANLSYARVHYTVANYVAEYEPFPNPQKKLPIAAAEIKVICNEISNKTKTSIPQKTAIKEFLRLLEKPFVKSLSTKDSNFIISDDCVSCGLCEKLCIVKNITMKDGRPAFHNDCAQCMGCVAFCPKGAINYKNKTQKRTKYHHPNISAKTLTVDELVVE